MSGRNEPTGTAKYGNRYFGIILEDGRTLYVYADFLYFESGVLLALRESGDKIKHLNLALPPGQWKTAYAASTFDGSPVAIDHAHCLELFSEPESDE